jgi:putative peptide modification system cyclase
MNPTEAPPSRATPGSTVTPLLRAVLLADLVDSTAFIERFGDERAALALQRLDLQIRDLLEFTGGRLIDKADGLLAIFERPIQAVDFALRYLHALRHFSDGDDGPALTARIGIHVGELMTWSNTDSAIAAGAKPLEVEGLAKPVAARLMGLALPGQILMSSMAQSLARRAQAELGERSDRLRWLVHGRYRFKGVPAPLLVHEVGEEGVAPLRQPPSGNKVWRDTPLWRRPPILAAEVVLVQQLATVYIFGAVRSPPALAFNERDWVVIGDLSNFTGDPRLEESLETALRIGMEQSRFVNIVPDLKVRGALERMGRSSSTSIDRAIGSEIAVREGARALLLPTVAEVGGKLRVSVEVVDPNSQTTVYSESAEARGIDSLLGTLDTVAVNMRERFGEAADDIKASSKPLPQATTANLNALRAYSLGQQAFSEGRYLDAIGLNEEALRLDPGFALAYLALARGRLHQGDDRGYYQLMDKAQALRGRLTHREQLLLDASMAVYHPTPEALGKWKLLAQLYPDEYSAYFTFGLTSWYHSYRYAEALEFLRPAIEARNPRRRSAYYLQGVLQMAQDRFPEALNSFRSYDSLGGSGYNRQQAEAYAALRRSDEAERLVAGQTRTGIAENDFQVQVASVLFPLDRGRWAAGTAAMQDLLTASRNVPADSQRRTRLMDLTLRSFAPDDRFDADVQSFVVSQRPWLDGPSLVVRIGDTFTTLIAGVLAAERGQVDTARDVLARTRKPALESGYPVLVNAVGMLEAALLVQDGKPQDAVQRLRPLHDGDELYLSHAVLMRALAASGRHADAAVEAEWLATHRGRAYAEFNIDLSLNAANVVQSNLALLSAAEHLVAAQQPAQARKHLDRFFVAWPEARRIDFLRTRLGKLESSLPAVKPAAI